MKNTSLIPANLPLTKSNFQDFCDKLIADKSISAMSKYIQIKAMESIIKTLLADKDFRNEVKESYLELTGGEINKRDFDGVEIKVISQLKKNELNKIYSYSAEVKSLENDIEIIETDLKLKKDILKAKKLQEINSGLATELVPSKETPVTEEFNLSVSFPKN